MSPAIGVPPLIILYYYTSLNYGDPSMVEGAMVEGDCDWRLGELSKERMPLQHSSHDCGS